MSDPIDAIVKDFWLPEKNAAKGLQRSERRAIEECLRAALSKFHSSAGLVALPETMPPGFQNAVSECVKLSADELVGVMKRVTVSINADTVWNWLLSQGFSRPAAGAVIKLRREE